jgi:hypothetical protein
MMANRRSDGDPKRTAEDVEVYHVELRQFPHNVCRFNLTELELRTTIVERWAHEGWIEVGERKWSPHQAKLTVLQGPRLRLEQLSMGRGWRAAQRAGRDVTAQVLAQSRRDGDDGALGAASPVERTSPLARDAATGRPVVDGSASTGDEDLLADSLGLALLSLLGADRTPLRRAWELAAERHPERTAGECLTLAERAVASLLRARLIALSWDADGADGGHPPIGEEQVPGVLRSIESWGAHGADRESPAAPVWILRV